MDENKEEVCPKCKGTGYLIFTDEKGYEYCKECECQEVVKAKRD